MAQFIIRVTLHDNASGFEYTRLRDALALAGVYDDIQSADERWYRLPGGEYRCDSELGAEQVRDFVHSISSSIKRSSVLVTAHAGSAWIGLEQIPEPLR